MKYLEKLENFDKQPVDSVKFPKNFSALAQDFFTKLCVFPTASRYEAQTALLHPWITREEAKIPMTIK